MRIKWSFITDDAHQELEHLYPRVPEGGIQIDDSEDDGIKDVNTTGAQNDEKGTEAAPGSDAPTSSDANTKDATGKDVQTDERKMGIPRRMTSGWRGYRRRH